MAERIAVVRALQLGDLLVAVPAFRAIRQRFPEGEITLIGLPWATWFAERFSMYVDRFVEFPGWPGIIEAPYDREQTDVFLEEQRAYGYDLAIQLHGSGSQINPFVMALGASATAGFYLGERPAGLTLAGEYRDDLPELLRLLRIGPMLGVDDPTTHLEFPLTDADHTEAASLLPSRAARTRIGMHPGASIPARRWPAERFAEVANRLVHRHGAEVVLTGGPDEVEIAGQVAALVDGPVVNLAGMTSIGGLAALIAGFDLYVTNDTGPSHIATALGVPSVTIFGPADVQRWAPLDRSRNVILHHPVPCNPCSFQTCPIDHRCLLGIGVDCVADAAERLLTRAIAA